MIFIYLICVFAALFRKEEILRNERERKRKTGQSGNREFGNNER